MLACGVVLSVSQRNADSSVRTDTLVGTVPLPVPCGLSLSNTQLPNLIRSKSITVLARSSNTTVLADTSPGKLNGTSYVISLISFTTLLRRNPCSGCPKKRVSFPLSQERARPTPAGLDTATMPAYSLICSNRKSISKRYTILYLEYQRYLRNNGITSVCTSLAANSPKSLIASSMLGIIPLITWYLVTDLSTRIGIVTSDFFSFTSLRATLLPSGNGYSSCGRIKL